MTRTLSATALLLALAFPIAAAAQVLSDPGSLAARFALTDRNHDQQIDRHELALRTVDVFYLRDADKDGALGPAELLPGLTADWLAAADSNKDGKLQLAEYLEARSEDFTAADTNEDGVLTLVEVDVYTP